MNNFNQLNDQQFLIIILILITLIIYNLYLIVISSDKYKSLNRLCNLNQDQLDAFFTSYDKIFNDQNMISTYEDYQSGKPPTRFVINENTKPSKYTEDCYRILNDLCNLGNVKKMYIPRVFDQNKGLIENQDLYEQTLAKRLNVKPGGKLLELGCGCGRASYHYSKLTGCDVYGINIDDAQLKDAREFTKENNSNNKFFKMDYNDTLKFDDNSFDGIYTVAGFCTFISDYEKVFSELYRVLKPGGSIVLFDGVLLEDFDRNNKEHMRLMVGSRMVMAGGCFIYYKYFEDIAKKVGLQIKLSKGGEEPMRAAELPLLINEHKHFDDVENFIYFLSCVKFVPSYMNDIVKRIRYGAEDLIEMEKQNLLTMAWDYQFVKPIN